MLIHLSTKRVQVHERVRTEPLPPLGGGGADPRRQLVMLQVLERYLVEHIAGQDRAPPRTDFAPQRCGLADHDRLTAAVAAHKRQLQLERASSPQKQRALRELADWVVVHLNALSQAAA